MTDISELSEMKPRITVFGVGGAGGNAVNNMIIAGLDGVEFVVANTDAQALTMSKAARTIQMGLQITQGLGAGSQPEVGRAAAEEVHTAMRRMNGLLKMHGSVILSLLTKPNASNSIAEHPHDVRLSSISDIS